MSNIEYIQSIHIDDACVISRAEPIEAERNTAIRDLLENNYFSPTHAENGPYHVELSVIDNRLKFLVQSKETQDENEIFLSILPFRRIIKDYFMICESYFQMVKECNNYKIEAIDMGRRGIHNEGSELLKELLREKIRIDFDTARRLFTLICVLHIK